MEMAITIMIPVTNNILTNKITTKILIPSHQVHITPIPVNVVDTPDFQEEEEEIINQMIEIPLIHFSCFQLNRNAKNLKKSGAQ